MDQPDLADVIDKAAGLNRATGVGALRRERSELLRLSQTSHRAALLPTDSGNLPHGERAALACRMARLLKDEALAAHYAGLLDSEGADPAQVALVDPHVTSAADVPHDCGPAPRRPPDAFPREGDARRRGAAHGLGLTDRDVVTLTGLIAFVNYQARAVAGLRMLKGE